MSFGHNKKQSSFPNLICEIIDEVDKSSFGDLNESKSDEYQNFLQEKKISDILSHSNHSPFLKFQGIYQNLSPEDSSKKSIVLALECGFGSMSQVLSIRKNYLENEILFILEDLLQGLVIIKNLGITHRDIKPKNLILAQEENGAFIYKISDFGCALNIKNDQLIEKKTIKALTSLYSAPELKVFFDKDGLELNKNRIYDPFKADIYSLGVVILRMMGLSPKKMSKVLRLFQKPSLASFFQTQGFPKIYELLKNMLNQKPENRTSFKKLIKIIHKFGTGQRPDENFVIKKQEKTDKLLIKESLSVGKKLLYYKLMIGIYYYKMKKYDSCLDFVNEALNLLENNKDLAQYEEIQSFFLGWFGAINFQKKNLNEAKEAYKQVLKLQTLILKGKESPQLVSINMNLAIIFEQKGDLKKALSFFEKSLIITNEIYGEKNEKALKILENISRLYENLKELNNSVRIYEEMIVILRTIYPENYLVLAVHYNNIGVLYIKKGEKDDKTIALSFLLQANHILKYHYGDSKKEVAASFNKIARVYQELKDYNSAILFIKKATLIYKGLYGENHEIIAECSELLAQSYKHIKNLPKALKNSHISYELYKKFNGDTHEKTIKALLALAQICKKNGDYATALESYHKSLKGLQLLYGDFDNRIPTCMNNMALSYKQTGDFTNALKYYEKALHLYLNIFGENHTNIATTYNNMGLLLQEMKNYPLAIDYFNKALKLFKALLGELNPFTLSCVNNLADSYRKIGILSKALDFAQESLSLSTQIYNNNDNDPNIYKSFTRLGLIYFGLGEMEKARRFQMKALEAKINVFGEYHEETFASMNYMASIEKSEGELNKALLWYEKAREIGLKIFAKNHKMNNGLAGKMANIYKQIGNQEKYMEFKILT